MRRRGPTRSGPTRSGPTSRSASGRPTTGRTGGGDPTCGSSAGRAPTCSGGSNRGCALGGCSASGRPTTGRPTSGRVRGCGVGGEVRSGRGGAEQQRRDHAAQPRVDVLELAGERPAVRTGREVRLHLGPLPRGQPAAGPGAEPVHRRPVLPGDPVGQVFLQVRLPQPLPGPVRQRRHPVRRQPQQRRDVGRRLLLDLGVPEHRLPPLRQPVERPRGQAGLQPGQRGVLPRHARVVPGHVVRPRQLLVPPGPVVERVAQRGEQVGPERRVRPSAGAQRVQHLGERLRDQVVGLGPRPGQLPGQVRGGSRVPPVEQPVRLELARPDRLDELGVAGLERVAGLRGSRQRDGHAVRAPFRSGVRT